MFELRDSTGVLGSFDSDGIRRLVKEGRLHREMEVRQPPSGEWWPISALKNLPASAFATAPPTSPPIFDSRVDLTTFKGSVNVPEDEGTDFGATLAQFAPRVRQPWPAVVQGWRRLPARAQPVLTGVVGVLIGAVIGSGYTAAHRYSAEAFRQQAARAQRAEVDLAAARGALEHLNANAEVAQWKTPDVPLAPAPARQEITLRVPPPEPSEEPAHRSGSTLIVVRCTKCSVTENFTDRQVPSGWRCSWCKNRSYSIAWHSVGSDK
jgi:hypothetical protein